MMVIRTIMDVSVFAPGGGSRPRKNTPTLVNSYSQYVRTQAESWCGRGDLNPHAFWAPPPQDGVSANFTTSAHATGTAKIRFPSRTSRLSKYSKDDDSGEGAGKREPLLKMSPRLRSEEHTSELQ